MQTILNISTVGWTQLGTPDATTGVIPAATVAVVEPSGTSVSLAIGSAPPAANAPGFTLQSGVPYTVPHVGTLGGLVYVRSHTPGASLRYLIA